MIHLEYALRRVHPDLWPTAIRAIVDRIKVQRLIAAHKEQERQEQALRHIGTVASSKPYRRAHVLREVEPGRMRERY